LKISANEQVEFLKKFYHHELGFSTRATNIVKAIIVLEQNEESILSGKTGGCALENGKTIGWLAGYVEKEGGEVGSR
jgi:beta-lactamase class D